MFKFSIDSSLAILWMFILLILNLEKQNEGHTHRFFCLLAHSPGACGRQHQAPSDQEPGIPAGSPRRMAETQTLQLSSSASKDTC